MLNQGLGLGLGLDRAIQQGVLITGKKILGKIQSGELYVKL